MSWVENALPANCPVEVRSRFDHHWTHGFEVVECLAEPVWACRIRRQSDGWVLPVLFQRDEIRAR